MTAPKIVAHMLIENEISWSWFALMSVIDYVDEIMVWDLGSTDSTDQVLKSINSPKIKFESHPGGGGMNLTASRQKMLNQSQSDWLLIVDGDEIWPRSAIIETVTTIRSGVSLDYLIQPYFNLIGDIYHYQEPKAGRYSLGGLMGHYTIRAINLRHFPGLYFDRPHGQQGIFDQSGVLIQDIPQARYQVMTSPYLHATHLSRSSNFKYSSMVTKRAAKYKYELGIRFPADFHYPPSFYLPYPNKIPSPWRPRTLSYSLNAAWQTPLKFLRRRMFTNSKSGY